MRKRNKHPGCSDPVIVASGHFARLADALDRGDPDRAADARAALRRLGYEVNARTAPPWPARPILRPFHAPRPDDGPPPAPPTWPERGGA